MVTRIDIINELIKRNRYKSYLEIGYFTGACFDKVVCEEKTAVDPNPIRNQNQIDCPPGLGTFHNDTVSYTIWKMNSDEFFEDEIGAEKSYDIIFIDGLHLKAQVLRDTNNSLAHLSPGGVIVLHDCNPARYTMAQEEWIESEWCGTVWQAILQIRESDNEILDFTCVDTDYGVGILQAASVVRDKDEKLSRRCLIAADNWDYFSENRKDLLNLITADEFTKQQGSFHSYIHS